MILSKEGGKRKIFSYLFIGAFLIALALILNIVFLIQLSPEFVTQKFSKVLQQKEKFLNEEFEKVKEFSFQENEKIKIDPGHEVQKQFAKDGIFFFVYSKDSLIYWSTNSVSCPERLFGKVQDTVYFEKQKNGWYEVIRKNISSKVFIGQILIKNQFLFENEYLDNTFEKDFKVPLGTEINTKRNKNFIVSSTGKILFSLKFPSSPDLTEAQIFLLFALFLSGFILLLISLYNGYCYFEKRFPSKGIFLLSFIIDIILIRITQFYFHIPEVLYASKLFGPQSFSSSLLLPSLGDLLVNSILFLFISYVFFNHFKGFQNTKKRKKLVRFIHTILLILLIICGFYACIELLHDLIVNSTIPFNLQDISNLKLSSIGGCFIISAVFLAYFLIAIRLIQLISSLILIKDFQALKRKKTAYLSFSKILLYLIFFSITGTFVMNYSNESIEKEKRKLLALKLGTSRDAMAELLFSKIEQNILHDSLFESIIADSSWQNTEEAEDSIERYLKKNYLTGYWNNYTFQATLCSARKTLRVQPHNYSINCRTYFQNVLNEFGKSTLCNNLYFLDYGYGYKNYLAVFPFTGIQNADSTGKNAYVEISSKLIFKDIGYPELLIDKKEGQIPDLSNYSYAYYRNGKLTHRVGNAQYKLEFEGSEAQNNSSAYYYSEGGYSHYYYPIDKSNILIVSKKESSLLDKIAPFSYLIFFFTFFTFLFFIIIRFQDVVRISFLRLGDRLQLSMAGMLALSLLITGGLVVYYIINLNLAKNQENISDKTHSLLVELQHKIGNANIFADFKKEDLNEMMTEFSNVFFIDVNLYNPEGRLIATSRPEIFEDGLSSDLMNREAFYQLKNYHLSYFLQREMIGSNVYNSAYIPFVNEHNQLQAYLNLPYFARQDELKKEISAFLVAFINIYGFLIILGIFLALLVSNYISSPLRMLASRISEFSYGKHNEKIEWKQQDEIGQLVEKYNIMIDELVKSANLLARSERETAWSQMARQVAHEIKNPLTPMKLSVQHLEKSWNDKAPDWSERLKRFTSTMTEQIESLSAIASEFSDFAKMPVTQTEKLDINEILENVKALYQDTPDIRFVFLYDNFEPHFILGDSKQLLRVFTNLLNNSIQAIGNNQEGNIRLVLERINENYSISISDSGEGISTELTEMIFQPNFTTKSGGMGLGLAIVRSIIRGLGGEITFESNKGMGTTFILNFPIYKPLIQTK